MKQTFAKRFKELRLERKITQKEMGDIFHVSRTTIYHWENEKQEPSLQMLVDISEFFGMSVEYLLGLVD